MKCTGICWKAIDTNYEEVCTGECEQMRSNSEIVRDFLKERINKYKEEGKTIWKDVEEFLKDKSIPVDERWELLKESQHRGVSGSYESPDGIDWNTTTYYDDFHTDRGVEISAFEMLENGDEVIIHVEAFKEWWLQSKYQGCVNDW